ncbi:BTB incomplete domain containing protein [Pandoravirus salinus]|uniref:BTB incomplete domain containing protein n=1 Tax=Pandoravirus salinus TaxID=1349410 RepID=S4VUI3_9VIRU|nr:BTB incomplete domain [Pandoravirus salinus]AGO84209.1 BTB incomplete domain containing protein [Pandoravirus salinus]
MADAEGRQVESEDAIVRLNVGGKPMLVAQSTLTKDARSVLGRMFAPDAVLPPATRLDDGSYFLDYDP